MKSYSRFTSEVSRRAWAIRRSLADIRGVKLMAVSWRECYGRARDAIVIAVRKSEMAAREAAYAARADVQKANAAWATWAMSHASMAVDHRRFLLGK